VSEDGHDNINFQSKVSSFGIENITNKDIVSFYLNFSETAYIDTGLLPVDGTGLLSIRSAGNHTQIAYQYKPGMYYINWGAHERDANAKSYYVAQPYRIVVADLHNGNLLGARTFYSPIPVQYPATPLYHVNLPNINCRGYRGNGVGWICLYHNEDISRYPFSEKLVKILERCSGVEVYNDANMSETDGPRFYSDHGKPSYLWNPKEWEVYSSQNDISWTLDPDLWIPILVQDKDHQDKHVNGGVPLTFADAILGNYQAYYYDDTPSKPFNRIARDDMSITASDIFNWFKQNYNKSVTSQSLIESQNTLEKASSIKEELSKVFVAPPVDHTPDEEDAEPVAFCDHCSENLFVNDNYIQTYEGCIVCDNCSDDVVWVEHMGAYFDASNESIVYIEEHDGYYYKPSWNSVIHCDNCGESHVYNTASGYYSHYLPIYNVAPGSSEDAPETVCAECHPRKEDRRCSICKCYLPSDVMYQTHSIRNDETMKMEDVCNLCYHTRATKFEKEVDVERNVGACWCGNSEELYKFQTVKHPVFVTPYVLGKNIDVSGDLEMLIQDTPDAVSTLFNSPENQTYLVKDGRVILHTNNYGLFVKTSKVCSHCSAAIAEDYNLWSNFWHNDVQNNIITAIEKSQENPDNPELFGTNIFLTNIF
jgi:hypothetical protein